MSLVVIPNARCWKKDGRRLIAILLGSLAVLAGPGKTLAQTDSLGGTVLPTLEIVDSITRAPLHSADALQLEADSLGQYPLAGLGVGDAVQGFEGVYLRDYGGHGGVQTLALRGFATDQTSLSIGGVPYRNPVTGSVDLSQFGLANFSAIRLRQGGGDANLNTRGGTLELDPQPAGTATHLRLGGGSFGEVLAGAGHAQRGRRTDWRLGLQGLRADDNYPFAINEVEGTREHADFRRLRGQAYLRHRLDDRRTLTAHHLSFRSERNIPGAVVKGGGGVAEERLEQTDAFQYVRYRQRGRAGNALGLLDWSATAKYHHDRINYQFQDTNEFTLGDALLSLQSRHALGGHVLTLNAQATRTALRSDNLLLEDGRAESVARHALNLGITDRRQWELPGAFRRLVLQAKFRANLTDQFSPRWNGGLALRADYRDHWQFFTHLSYSNRLPSFNELYYFGFGNPSLKPEVAAVADGGLLLREPGGWPLRLKLSGFYNRTRNKIIAIPLSPVRWSTQSLGHTSSAGTEAGLELRPLAWLRATLNGTWLVAREDGLSGGNELPYTPQVLAKSSLTAEWGGWQAGISFLYSGRRFASLQNDRFTRLPAYHLLDGFVQYRFPVGSALGQVRAGVTNLLGRDYAVIQSFPMPRRRLRVVLGIFL